MPDGVVPAGRAGAGRGRLRRRRAGVAPRGRRGLSRPPRRLHPWVPGRRGCGRRGRALVRPRARRGGSGHPLRGPAPAPGPGGGPDRRRGVRRRLQGHEPPRRVGRAGGRARRRTDRGRPGQGRRPLAACDGHRPAGGRGRDRRRGGGDRRALRTRRAGAQGGLDRGGRAPRVRAGARGGHRDPRAGMREPGHVPRLPGTGGPFHRRRDRAGTRAIGGLMATRVIEVPRHLRLVKSKREERTPAELAARHSRMVLVLIGATAALTALGLVMVLSASSVSSYAQYGSSFLFFKRQAVYAVVGIAAMILTSRMRYGVWQRLALPVLALTTVLLLFVLRPGTGTVVGGSARWIALGPVTIQPSEIAKLAVIAFAATILTRKKDRLHW